MQQLELFDYRKDYLFDSNNQIAHYYDILKETEDTISYAEHIDPKKGYAIAGMEYEEYIDNLDFIKNKGKYGLYFQGGICKINKESFEYIESKYS